MTSHFLSRPALLHAIDRLNLKPRKKLSAFFVGDIDSRMKGAGVQFSDFRPYEWGDDIRHVSWNASAKAGKTILKSYDEEKELNLFLLIDISGSSLFGSDQKRKIDMYAEVAAVLGLAALKHGYRVGALFFDKAIQQFFPLTRKKEDFLQLVQSLPNMDLLEHSSDLHPALAFIHQSLKQRSLVIILSDFLMPSFKNEILRISDKHEIILIRGYDDAEQAVTSRGVFEICDPETGEFFLFDTESEQSRKALQLFYTNFVTEIEKVAGSCQADLLPLSVQDDYFQRLVLFFDHR